MAISFGSNKKIPLEEQQGALFLPPIDEIEELNENKSKSKKKNKADSKENKKTKSKSKSAKKDKAEERKEQIKNYKKSLGITNHDIALDFIIRTIDLVDQLMVELHNLRQEREGAIKNGD